MIVLLLSVLTGCSLGLMPRESISWKEDGVLLISRPAPQFGTTKEMTVLGFLPSRPETWLSIKRGRNEVVLMEGDKKIRTSKGEGLESVLPGEYHILHKQRTPLWYAPEQYFAARQMDVPAEGDRARYLRGALGEYAIYIDEKTPLHCGPVWTEEIGGIKLSDESLARLFYLLDIGASVKVE